MTDRSHKLSLTRQADLLWISRGSLYYEPRLTSEDDLKLMRRIDELHMEYPFAGSRMMKGLLRQEGFTAGRLHVATCMKRMGIQALYRKPNTSKPAPGHMGGKLGGLVADPRKPAPGTKQARVVQLLVARVTVGEDGLDIDLRHDGLGALASLMTPAREDAA